MMSVGLIKMLMMKPQEAEGREDLSAHKYLIKMKLERANM